jgi:hypothetical protein
MVRWLSTDLLPVSRWTPHWCWPVLPQALPVVVHAPRSPRHAGTRRPSLAERRSLPRSFGATNPVAQGPEPAAFFSSLKTLAIPARDHSVLASSTSWRPMSSGRFSGVHHWPVLGVHRGRGATCTGCKAHYYPTFGWSWVVAPWVLGFGIAPYWGPVGPGHFAWYARPWFLVGTAHLRTDWGPGVGPRGGFRSGGGHMGGGHGRR